MFAVVIRYSFNQLANLCGVSDEVCWDFVSTNVGSLSTEINPNSDMAISTTSADTVQMFLQVLSRKAEEIPRNLVGYWG